MRDRPGVRQDSKWSPTPTVGHDIASRLSGPVAGIVTVPVLRLSQAAKAVIGRHWALL